MFDDISEDMTEEEIEKAEKDMESARKMLKDLSEWQSDWEKMGIDRSQIDSSAKADIGIIGEENWLGRRLEKLKEFEKQLEEAEEMVKKSKENLKKKQA